MTEINLVERIQRIEAHLAIQQLPPRYAVAVDSRDLDALVDLFVPDVNVGRRGIGRPALKDFYNTVLRDFYRSQHLICGHVIDLIDADNATGKVYCHAEHEDNGHWVAMNICYFDTYAQRDGNWHFVKRDEQHWYSTDVLARPGEPEFQHWPGKFSGGRFQPRLPQSFPTWKGFWDNVPADQIEKLTRRP